jgi:diadenosine tetraphosphatase ApaH/serine/threonine PP2A family protein phosphatase
MIALLADIHANREALTACLADAARRQADQYVFLGDLVGYGADPGWVVDRVMELAGQGARVIQGNHDAAAAGARETMNETAASAIAWTRRHLNAAQLDFLRRLPVSIEDGRRLFVHASAHEPSLWHYILDSRSARKSLEATAAQQTFCGHVHVPTLYHLTLTGKLFEFVPVPETPIPLLHGRRWLVVLGAVGQPRDRNPAACYGLLDEVRNELAIVRVPYDTASAARKIRATGLPAVLAARLEQGH